MSETIIFRCDFCGAPSGEEPPLWRPERCSVELILRGRRFVLADGIVSPQFPVGASVPGEGFPFTPEMQHSSNPQEDFRHSLTLCDGCTQKIAGLLGLKLETPDEYAARRAQVAAQVESDSIARAASTSGRLVAQYPNREYVSPPGGQDNGGLVAQFPTDPSSPNYVEGASKNVDGPSTLDEGNASREGGG